MIIEENMKIGWKIMLISRKWEKYLLISRKRKKVFKKMKIKMKV